MTSIFFFLLPELLPIVSYTVYSLCAKSMSVPKAVFIPFHTNKRLDKQLHVKINDEYLWSDVWPLRRADRPSFKYSANLVG